ncbi:nitrogen fixation protein NifZ [Mesobacillus maritimus]|uniref:nitrogen fixation protein NifZ n=1 Tax=Mesobacillus maritimus TaxID=1643336 RepID=UPI00203B919C|nr:nitrogen fixation protein NifZ [Mesobacillus maritimus]MCM3669354.1 nitrogen fixation protein NifZ [Mesobacillus maritimus]
MAIVKLKDIAQSRSGDKGNIVNVGVFAPNQAIYQVFLEKLTPEKVKEHFAGLVKGEVVRYELPNIFALNFVCKEALDGGGSSSTRLDNLGKCFGSNMLRLEIEVDDYLLKDLNNEVSNHAI